MLKLGDLILASYSSIVIMDGIFEAISFDPCRVEKLKLLIPYISECEVEKLDVNRNVIRIWLKEDE